MPDFTLETALSKRYGSPVAGVDEAGRGPLAGQVVAAAVILRRRARKDVLSALDDSKKVPAERREAIAAQLPACGWIGIGAASVAEIDRLNILGATHLAMQRAVAALPQVPRACLIDGNQPPMLACPAESVIQGDSLSLSIAAASIMAKVMRDRLMSRLAVRYPVFGWHTNVGYATPEHQAALTAAGATPHHRRSFAPVQAVLAQEES